MRRRCRASVGEMIGTQPRSEAAMINFGELRYGEVRRIHLLKLSEKESEQGFEGGFGRHEENETGRKEPSRRSLGLRHGSFQGYSDCFSRHLEE